MEQERIAPRWRRRSVLAVGFASVATAAAGSAAWLTRRPPPAGADPQLRLTTATIARQTLLDERSFPARLDFGPSHRVQSPLTGMITWLPELGSVVERGQVLLRIDDRPVVLLYGELPAYRDLTAAVKGNDAKQLEANLKALGHSRLTEATLRRWQTQLGLEPTGVLELGRVFYAAGPVRIAGHELAVGQRAGGPILAYTATARLVTAELKPHEQELARKGADVVVALQSGATAAGRVVALRQVKHDGQRDAAELEADIALADPQSVSGLDDGPVTVRVVVGERKEVLVVPVGALLALAEGGFGLEIVEPAPRRIVAVQAGLFASGKVEVSGSGIAEGMTVGMAR